MTDIDRAIIEHMRRYAPDSTHAEIAVSLGLPMRAVKRAAKGIEPAVSSKVREHRRIVGILADRLYEATPLTWEEIAEQAGCTRQHLHKCREEARQDG